MNPSFSVIVPTRNSSKHIEVLLASVANQSYPGNLLEVILADNDSSDNLQELASRFNARIVNTPGPPPQVCKQRNRGADAGRGDYLYFVDHDMEFPSDFFRQIADEMSGSKEEIGAWYVPERILSNSKLMAVVRNFESISCMGSVVAAPRIFKREVFYSATKGFDDALSGGPADWDIGVQLWVAGIKFATLTRGMVYHHEETLEFRDYIGKKGKYAQGVQLYIDKWTKLHPAAVKDIIKKQVGFAYRFFGLYFERGKWKYTLRHFHFYILLLGVNVLKGLQFLRHRKGA